MNHCCDRCWHAAQARISWWVMNESPFARRAWGWRMEVSTSDPNWPIHASSLDRGAEKNLPIDTDKSNSRCREKDPLDGWNLALRRSNKDARMQGCRVGIGKLPFKVTMLSPRFKVLVNFRVYIMSGIDGVMYVNSWRSNAMIFTASLNKSPAKSWNWKNIKCSKKSATSRIEISLPCYRGEE